MENTAYWGAADVATYVVISCCIGLGLVFALYLFWKVLSIPVISSKSKKPRTGAQDDTKNEALLEAAQDVHEIEVRASEIGEAIATGARSFLFTEYMVCLIFMVIFAAIVFVLLGSEQSEKSKAFGIHSLKNAGMSTISFILGFLTSIASGYIGMTVATYANSRTALKARQQLGSAFNVAFQAGGVMGFTLTSLGLLVLFVLIIVYMHVVDWAHKEDGWKYIYEAIAGYGLGGSSMALFGRVGGGIYTKAADVGADLVGKIEKNIPEDDPRNPAVIADNVGDNVGDIAGMGADLFGSFAESSCAALVVASVSDIGKWQCWTGMCFPLYISAGGIAVGFFAAVIAIMFPPSTIGTIERMLKIQLLLASGLMTPVIVLLAFTTLPKNFTLEGQHIQNWYMAICVISGLWGGMIIGLFTEYFTSNSYFPVQELAESCRTGPATNIIYGLALGYKSAIVPAVVIAVDIYISFQLAGMFGIACAALGMLSILSTCLAIDAYGPIADNAGGIAEMANMGHDVRERTDALDSAGNTTAAIGKGFAIGSAALVSLALFGAFITRTKTVIGSIDTSVLSPQVFFGLVLGAMLPYWFSAMTMKSVGKASLAMVEEVRRQFREIPGIMEGTQKPDYKKCVEISTASSLAEMISPGLLVMGTPIVMGTLFGVSTLAGVLVGALVSGIQMANSMSNTGGAWDNAKKYIEAGATEKARNLGGKGSDEHHASVVGDTVGDPLKDTSGPSLNILIKLMAVESLVFAPFFTAKFLNSGKGVIYYIFKY